MVFSWLKSGVVERGSSGWGIRYKINRKGLEVLNS